MLYLQKKSKNWWIKFRVGKTIIRTSSGTSDKKTASAIEKTLLLARQRKMPGEALHKLLDNLLEPTAGNQPTGTPLTTTYELYTQLLRAKNKSISKKELGSRKARLYKLWEWITKNRPDIGTIEQVDRLCAMTYAQHLAQKGITSKTRASTISAFSTIWKALATIRETITHNPWYAVAPEVKDTRRGQPFTKEQAETIITAAEEAGHGWGLACRIALYTGLRYGDIVHLEWSNINTVTQTLTITPSKTARHDITINLPLARPLLNAFRQEEQKQGPIFPELKTIYPHQHKTHPFRLILEIAGLDPNKYTFHSWRHTFRTRLAEAGISDDIAKRLGGWTNDKMSMHYAHGGRETEMRKAVNRI